RSRHARAEDEGTYESETTWRGPSSPRWTRATTRACGDDAFHSPPRVSPVRERAIGNPLLTMCSCRAFTRPTPDRRPDRRPDRVAGAYVRPARATRLRYSAA